MEFGSCINYLLGIAQHSVFQKISAQLEPFGITAAQYGVLNFLWERGRGTPKELGQVLGLENSTISSMLDRMQKKELIDRLVDPNDRRSVLVVLTPKSEALREGVLETVDTLNNAILSDLDPSSAENLLSSLRKIGQIEEKL